MTEFEFLDIMHRAEMLKNNTRHSWTSQDRHESVAEHSWRLAFMVLMYSHELKKECSFTAAPPAEFPWTAFSCASDEVK